MFPFALNAPIDTIYLAKLAYQLILIAKATVMMVTVLNAMWVISFQQEIVL